MDPLVVVYSIPVVSILFLIRLILLFINSNCKTYNKAHEKKANEEVLLPIKPEDNKNV